jgi:hypothetical protein
MATESHAKSCHFATPVDELPPNNFGAPMVRYLATRLRVAWSAVYLPGIADVAAAIVFAPFFRAAGAVVCALFTAAASIGFNHLPV